MKVLYSFVDMKAVGCTDMNVTFWKRNSVELFNQIA